MRQAKNSFLARKNQPAAVLRRRKPTAATSAAFVSSWMTRPVSAVNPKAKTPIVPFSSILLMILLAGAAIGISSIVGGRDRLKDARTHNVKVKQEVESLTDEIHRLGDENKAMVSDPKVIEHIVREQFGWVKKGELPADTTEKQ